MHRKASFLTELVVALGGALLLTGCPDTEGEFCAFDQRYKDDFLKGVGRDKCESVPIVIDTDCDACATTPITPGMYPDNLFALSTKIAPALPILFDAQMEVDAEGNFSLVLEPLKCDGMTGDCPKTKLGNPFTVGPFPLDGGYCLLGTLAPIDIPGEANPITGNPVTAQDVVLKGSICSPADFECGTIPDGDAVVGGNPIPLGGEPPSTWTIEKLATPGTYPDMPKLKCEDAP